MNKISFIIEFDEVSKTQEEQLTEFIEKTGIKFQVLESDNDLKKYKKYKEVIDKAIKYIEEYRYITDKVTDEDSLYYGKDITLFAFNDDNVMELLEILKEVE